MAEIKIIVERHNSLSSSSGSGKSQSKGIIRRKREDEILGRRQRKAGGFIQFYDLGQILSGETWITRNFGVAGSVSGYDPIENGVDLMLSDFLARDQSYLNDSGILTDEGRKIDFSTGDYFGIYIYSTDYLEFATTENDKWTDEGLEISDDLLNDSNIAIQGGGVFPNDSQRYFAQFVLTGDGKNHITNVYDINAPAVPYSLGKSDKFYLCPEIVELKAENNYAASRSVLGYTYCTYPRRFDKVLEFYKDAGSGTGSNSDYEESAMIASEISNALAFTYDSEELSLYRSITPEEFAVLDIDDENLFSVRYLPVFFVPQLAAIIKRGSQVFYVWRS